VYTILSKYVLAPTITKFEIEVPLIARKRKPGNFVIVRATETGERIPLTICDSDPLRGSITLIIQAIGKTTTLITRMEEGDAFLDIVGPLGHPTPIENFGTVICIGGGVGTAEVYPIAQALKEAGNKVLSIIGARSRDLIILEEEMQSISDSLYITTDDGSYGEKGFVTDVLQKILDSSYNIACVYAIGPIPMMRAAAEVTRPYEIKTFVSLNPIMMDGTGMCGACRVTVDGKMKFACVDGPEFDAHRVNFDELIARNKTYADLEQLSLNSLKESEQECKTAEAYEIR
jgi:ferredoxin/flavodoxin---NADP+ reductase